MSKKESSFCSEGKAILWGLSIISVIFGFFYGLYLLFSLGGPTQDEINYFHKLCIENKYDYKPYTFCWVNNNSGFSLSELKEFENYIKVEKSVKK